MNKGIKYMANDLSIIVHPHPIVEMQLKIKNDEIGLFAECLIYNTEKKEVESSFFIDEDKAKEIIDLMQKFLKLYQNK